MRILDYRFVLFLAHQDHLPVEIYNLVNVRLDNHVLLHWSHKISKFIIMFFTFFCYTNSLMLTSKLDLLRLDRTI